MRHVVDGSELEIETHFKVQQSGRSPENFQTPERTEGPDPEGPGLRGAGGPEKAGGVGGGVGGVVSPGFEGASARPSASIFDDLLEDYIE